MKKVCTSAMKAKVAAEHKLDAQNAQRVKRGKLFMDRELSRVYKGKLIVL